MIYRPRSLLWVLTLGVAALAQTPHPMPMSPEGAAPATAPATTQAMARVEPDAEPVLARLAAAYAAVGPLHVTGQIVGTFDVAGRRQVYQLPVDGRTDGVGRFRHDAGYAGLIVSDTIRTFIYDQRRGAYTKLPADADRAPGRQPAADVDSALVSVLLDENPILLLTLTDDPAALLRRAATTIRLAPTTRPDDFGLVLEQPAKQITLRLDARDATIRASDIDYAPLMKSRKATAVKAAGATLTYTRAVAESSPPETFTWQPPDTATEFDLPGPPEQKELARSATTRPTSPSTRPTD
ncbi:MAG TPA: hypothetical protein VF595_18315 [Tepidisphaeraceae bacterium]